MKKLRFIIRGLLILGGLNFICFAQSWAEPSQMKMMNELQGAERKQEYTIVRPKVEYTASDSRDPFTGINFGENVNQGSADIGISPPDLTIQGIIWGGRLTQAIINNKVLGVGDSIQGVKIIGIGKEGVTVLFGGRSFILGSPAAGSTAIDKEE